MTPCLLRVLWLGVLFVASISAQSRSPRDLGQSKVLVASRDLADPNFAKTVILLVHYDADSVLGLVLNRHTDVPLSKALDGLKAAKGRADSIYLGGPVEPTTVFAMLQSQAKLEGAPHVLDEVYLITNKSVLEQTLGKRPDPGVFHVYFGYAGWTNDQLRREVEHGAWFIFHAEAATVFDSEPDALWSRMIRKTEQQMALTIFGPR